MREERVVWLRRNFDLEEGLIDVMFGFKLMAWTILLIRFIQKHLDFFFFKENLVLKQYRLEALRVINNRFKQKD